MTKLALTPKEAAEACSVSVDVIRAAYRSGQLQVRHIGPQKLLIDVDDLRDWLRSLPTERMPA